MSISRSKASFAETVVSGVSISLISTIAFWSLEAIQLFSSSMSVYKRAALL